MQKHKFLTQYLFIPMLLIFLLFSSKIDSYALSPLEKYNAFITDSKWANGSPWGGDKTPEESTWPSQGCCAYIADFVKVVYGSNNYTKGQRFTNASEIRAGDVIHLAGGSGHFFVVLNREGNTLCTAEGNFSYNGGPKMVSVTDNRYRIENGALVGCATGHYFEYGFHWEDLHPSPAYSTPFIDGGRYIIKSALSGKALEVPSGTTEKVDLQVWSYAEDPWQTWICKKNGDCYSFINGGTGQAMDIRNNSTSDGAQLIQYPEDRNTAVQKFRILDAGNGKYAILSEYNKNGGTGRAIDLYGSSTANGVKVCLYNYHGRDNQLWTFTLVNSAPPTLESVVVSNASCVGQTNTGLADGGIYIVKSALSGKALEVPSGTSSKVDLQVWSYAGDPWQQWVYKKNGNSASLINNYTKQAIDIRSNSTANGAQLIQYPEDKNTSVQRFKIEEVQSGKYRILSDYNKGNGVGRAVDLYGSSTANGVKVRLYDYHGRDNQLWTFTPVDTAYPSISNVRISDLDYFGYTITCTVTDDSGIARVAFPTWTEKNGQDELLWMDGTRVSGNTYSFRVNFKSHKNELGQYITHIYAYDKYGKTSIIPVTVKLK